MPPNPSPNPVPRLKALLGREKVSDELIDRIALSPDASFYLKTPLVVVRPTTINDIRALFQIATEARVPLTFRAAGTSLSGQAVTDGILVDLSRGWRRIEVQSDGNLVRVQPGAVGSWVNESLRSFHRKMGPDPASINAAMMGGILANNSSGMCCGVVHNAYHTLQDITAVLPNGFIFSPGEADAEERLRHHHPDIFNGILALRERILNDGGLKNRIQSKYRIKNTVGYSLNAFIDYERPLDILAHLLIGSEGTLGFIAEATLRTIPSPSYKLTGLLFFHNARDAGAAVPDLLDAAAVELMDYSSLQSIRSKVGLLEEFIATLGHEAACLLIEYEFNTEEERDLNRERILRKLQPLPLIREPGLTDRVAEQSLYWSIRKGLYPAVGSMRPAGTSALIEDVAVPVERLADLTVELQALFKKHGYEEAIIFGHAKDGNLHFVITPSFDSPEELQRYEGLMNDVVDAIIHRFNGSLKGEHGTGRNMAPFVEMEWGSEAYGIMRELKELLDPVGICNPGVIINEDPRAHLKDLKSLPVVDPLVDLCIECGYCESKCPSRDLTLSPRQRIVVRRRIAELQNGNATGTGGTANASVKKIARDIRELEASYKYSGIDTCAADGLCALACPVGIDTGNFIKKLRESHHSTFARKAGMILADHFRGIEGMLRVSLRGVRLFRAGRPINRITNILRLLFPAWPFFPEGARAPRMIRTVRRDNTPADTYTGADAHTHATDIPAHATAPGALPAPLRVVPEYDFLYFQTCLSRNLGAYPHQQESLADTLLTLASRAGIRLKVPESEGYCCGMPFQSKGYSEAHDAAHRRTLELLYRESEGGRLPVIVDASPCTLTLIHGIEARMNRPEQHSRSCESGSGGPVARPDLQIMDSVEFAAKVLLPRLQIHHRKNEIVIHPVCSVRKMNLTEPLRKIGEACAERVTIPFHAGCCGMAGDRGLMHPELTQSATAMEMLELKEGAGGRSCEGYFSSSRMCEEGLSKAGGQDWVSFLYLLKEATNPRLDVDHDHSIDSKHIN